ncbi:MAG TPA: HlyD family efflux transporter periplasmic adaptor subunit [Gemmatimonadales bacterium]|nr:HlyD family efflux transporter periplasmic adaptor subunit [Gemmatimonadales bacterium]
MSAAPKLRPDLTIVEQTYRGEQSFIVKDPKTRKYFRFRPLEVRVLQQFDGGRSAADIAAALSDDGIRLSAATVEKFAAKLKTMGLLERTVGERSVLQMERLRAQRRQRLKVAEGKDTDIFRLRWSAGDPDEFMNRTMPYLRWMFTRGFLIASLVLFAIYVVIAASKWSEVSQAFSDLYHFRYSLGQFLTLYVAGAVIIVIHELGHGYTCKYFGGEVHEIGAMLLYFEPAFFCNVNDAWTFPDLKARLWVTAAGSWIQLVAASLAAIVWWAATPDTLISHLALSAVLIGGVTTIIMNANPLIPLDGYFALSDWLEVPNLRQRAFAHLAWLVKTRVLRLDVPMPPADEREQRIFLIYSLLALWYISSIMLVVAGTVYGWMDRALGAIGIGLFALAIWLMARGAIRSAAQTGAAAWRQFRAGVAARRLRDRAALLLVVVLLIGALIPRPITVTGPFAVAPALSVGLTSPDSGIVAGVYVREGTRVEAGMPLLQVRDLDLERAALEAGRRVDSISAREAQARAAGHSDETARLEAERATESARLDGMAAEQRLLTLRALVPGVVVTSRPERLTGRWVELGQHLLELGQPDSLEIRIALVGAGATQVRAGQPARLVFHADGRSLAGRVGGVALSSAAGSGAVEARIGLRGDGRCRPGMTGEASVTLRESNLWGALWWSVRRRVRTDILL